MVSGSKEYLLKTKKQIEKDLEKFNMLEEKKNNLLKEIPLWVQEKPLWKLIVWEKIDVDDFELKVKQIEKYLNKVNSEFPELLEIINKNRELFVDFDPNNDKFKTVSLKESILLKVKENEQALAKKAKLDELESILQNVPKVTNKKDYIENRFDTVNDAKTFYLDNGAEFFDCGADQYQDEAYDYCYIQDSLFKVELGAIVFGTKNIEGCHKYYYVEEVSNVKFLPYNQDDLENERKQNLENRIKEKEAELNKLKNSI
jgi:hypothetical protein